MGQMSISVRLIETWDVLKLNMTVTHKLHNGLIETWDVLKFPLNFFILYSLSINRNMRCIEIRTWQT